MFRLIYAQGCEHQDQQRRIAHCVDFEVIEQGHAIANIELNKPISYRDHNSGTICHTQYLRVILCDVEPHDFMIAYPCNSDFEYDYGNCICSSTQYHEFSCGSIELDLVNLLCNMNMWLVE